ncbi:MAG: hypothetical protein IJ399_00010 [Bacilli bacterium]|nr:hypothetical protein [Bacilli bacterium]
MKGYKLLDIGLINEYGFKYEINKIYTLEGELKWNHNGFHFCTNIEDTLRYRDKEKGTFEIVEVESLGNLVDGSNVENDYYGYETGYATDKFRIIKIITREELIDIVLKSNNINRITRLIYSIPLSEEEITKIKEMYPNKELINQYIDYYQYDKKDAFSLKKR